MLHSNFAKITTSTTTFVFFLHEYGVSKGVGRMVEDNYGGGVFFFSLTLA